MNIPYINQNMKKLSDKFFHLKANSHYLSNPTLRSTDGFRSVQKCKPCEIAQKNYSLDMFPNAYYSKVSFCGINEIPKSEFEMKTSKGSHLAENEKTAAEYGSNHKLQNYEGCILGGAIGDAFGVPVEFKKIKQIQNIYGNTGLNELITNDLTGKANFSDDTQLTMYTADGLIKSILKYNKPDMSTIHQSYKDWYTTCAMNKKCSNGWIQQLPELKGFNGSGKTCMKSLAGNKMGSIENPINESRGCGGVMRAAPAGLLYYNHPDKAFDIAAQCAAITHGHPDAYLSAGVYAAIIANLIQGVNLDDAIDNSLIILKKHKGCENVLEKIELAKELSKKNVKPQEAIEQIGFGRNGDGAIADAVYFALKTPNDFESAIINAVNHSGDSDTIASITGGILGAYLGINNIPADLTKKIQMKKELNRLSSDLYDLSSGKINNKMIKSYLGNNNFIEEKKLPLNNIPADLTKKIQMKKELNRLSSDLYNLSSGKINNKMIKSYSGNNNFIGEKNSIMNNKTKLPLYFHYTNTNYNPDEEEQKMFDDIQYFALNEDSSAAQFVENLIMFDSEIKENDNGKKVFLLSSLIEALDKSQLPQKRQVIIDSIENFAAQYDKEIVQTTAKTYSFSDILNSDSTKNYIKSLII